MEDSELFNILIYLSILSPLFPIGTILVYKLHSFRVAALLLVLAVLSLGTDLISLEFAKNDQTTDTITHVFTLLSGVTIFSLFFTIFESNKLKKLVIVAGVGLIIFEYLEMFAWNGLKESNFISYIYLSLSILVLSLIFFFHRMNRITARKEIFDHLFWINSAFLLYYGSTLIISLFENYIRFESPEIFIFIWPIQLVANVIFNLLLVKGLWIMRKM